MASAKRDFRITGLSHVALFTADLEKSMRFYGDFLGYEEQFRLTEPDGRLALTFVKINDLQCIELFPQRSSDEDRLYQVALIVENIEGLRRHLGENGIAVPPSVKKGRIGNSNFSVKDPDGHVVEFVQYESDGWTMRDTGKHMTGPRISAHMRHAGFTVRRLDASLAFYRGLLGFRETWRGSSDGKTLSWVNAQLPDGQDYVELMLYGEPPSRERLGVLNHLCLEVADVPASAETLKTRGDRAGYGKPIEHKVGINRRRLMNLFDADGTRSELMEPGTVDGKPPAWSDTQPPA
jgi:catechol 2,3-dioxygenase-like lactoylglutathione lyase family enzyme